MRQFVGLDLTGLEIPRGPFRYLPDESYIPLADYARQNGKPYMWAYARRYRFPHAVVDGHHYVRVNGVMDDPKTCPHQWNYQSSSGDFTYCRCRCCGTLGRFRVKS
jgi:hypothetical protein